MAASMAAPRLGTDEQPTEGRLIAAGLRRQTARRPRPDPVAGKRGAGLAGASADAPGARGIGAAAAAAGQQRGSSGGIRSLGVRATDSDSDRLPAPSVATISSQRDRLLYWSGRHAEGRSP